MKQSSKEIKERFSRRGGISMEVIIIAAVALLVLVILSVLLIRSGVLVGGGSDSLDGFESWIYPNMENCTEVTPVGPGSWAPVPSLYVEPEPFDFCPGGVLVRDPSVGIKEDCDIIEYPNGTREKVNCVWFDDAVLHYRCVNATVVQE